MSNSYLTILDKLSKAVETNAKYKVEDALNKNLLAEDARKYDKELLNLLQKDKDLKSHFFTETDGGLVFKKDVFLQFISNKEFLPDSYTRYANKIGLGSDDGSLLSGGKDVVLNWPYKDAVLEGGQDKEDQKRSEVFFNEVLAPDQITRLLDDKVFTNWKRYDKDGERDLDELKDDDNLIIKGNNLVVLHSLEKRYAGKVKLIYIDPPYNTGGDSFGYNDRFNHSSWLTFMKNRLSVARRLLQPDGMIFVQCDDNEEAYLKVLMDELFGQENFINHIVVKMSHLSGVKMAHAEKKLPKIKESILLYSKNKSLFSINPLYSASTWKDSLERYNQAIININDQVKDWKAKGVKEWATSKGVDVSNQNALEEFMINNSSSIFRTARNASIKGTGLKGVFFKDKSSRGLDRITYNDEEVIFASSKVRMIEGKLSPVEQLGDIWNDIGINNLHNEGGVSLKNGKKPEKLLHRIISIATKPGDIVLDYHLGSGTTATVAHKMGRQYIGIEQLYYGDNDPTVRLQNVINGDQSGISKSVDWQGGGSFVYANIMNNANKFRKRVESAKDDKEYLALLEEATSSSFLSYRVDPTKLNENEFRKLSSADKRRLLLELIDNNTLYVNYEDINDPSFKVSDTDKKFNKELYK